MKRKRGRKRKILESSECNEDGKVKKEKVEKGEVQVSGRVLRSQTMTVGLKRSDEGTPFFGRPKKKLKRRGRPPKVLKKDEKTQLTVRSKKKLKRCGRPPKIKARILATCVIKMRNVKFVAVKNTKNDVERGPKIDRRSREGKMYKDCVYIEPSGRSHWSITRAYAVLKKKIEENDADNNEISGYTPIPEEEMSILFRPVDKILGYKKKKNRIGKNLNKATKSATLKKKKKDGSKRKTIWKSVARFGNKTRHVKGLIESRKPRLIARSSEKMSKQDNDGSLVYGKRNLLSWMIDSGVILLGSKVQYGKTRRQKKSSEGVITSDGIRCRCCNEIMGISQFVAHVGRKLDQTLDKIYLESGTSLRKCLIDSWRKEEESNTIRFNLVNVKGDDPNDDTCNICGDGGNLICCDGCPSTFHQSCLDIHNFPSRDWNCIYCLCKFCGVVSDNAPRVDELPSEMLLCCLCEEKFHRLCLHEVEAVNTDSGGLLFCGRKCQEVFERLQSYLGMKLELEDGFSWSLLQRSDIGQDFTGPGTELKVERNSKLAVAFSVMDECFVPIVDERSRTNIIHDVVYNCGV